MSVYVMMPVFETTRLTSSEKLVALSLADNARDDGGSVYPGVSTTAEKTGLSERTVQRILRSLEEKGVIAVQKVATNKFPTIYKFLLSDDRKHLAVDDPRGDMVTPPESLGVTSTTSRGDIDDSLGCHGVTQTINKPSIEPTTSTGVDAPPSSRAKIDYTEDFEKFWSVYPRKKMKQVAFDKFKARLRAGESLEEILSATSKYDDHCKSNDIEEEFILHPATFLAKDRWKEYLPARESMDGERMWAALAYDAYDQDESWYDSNVGDDTFDNPAFRGYNRPVNSEGQMIDAEGKPYKLDAQGVRHYWD